MPKIPVHMYYGESFMHCLLFGFLPSLGWRVDYVNPQELQKLKKFSDALLARAGKLEELISDLESGLAKKPDFSGKDRLRKSDSQISRMYQHLQTCKATTSVCVRAARPIDRGLSPLWRTQWAS